MFRRDWISPIVLFSCVTIFATDFAQALPRRRRRQSQTYYAEGSYYSETGFQQVAPKVDSESSGHRVLSVNYSYERANQPEFAYTNKVRVFLDLWDDEVLGAGEKLVAEVSITDLSNSQNCHVRYLPVSIGKELGEYVTAEVEVGGEADGALIAPAKVYRLFINLHRRAEEYGDESVIGRVAVPYYAATGGESRVDRARQAIAMRTFREFYYTERGWSTGENYPMDCYAYYMWATGVCTVGAYNNWTNLEYLFNDSIPFHSSGQIPELAKEGPILGDYVRQPGHSFMLLAYDPELEQVWTMEANFGHTIEVVNRYVGAGWSVGHLVDEHIRPGLYPTSSSVEEDSTSVAVQSVSVEQAATVDVE
jgi:hypothetical protein